jgi:hypothetical protein
MFEVNDSETFPEREEKVLEMWKREEVFKD